MKRVGRVVALTRFLVKSMAGEPREAVELGWSGIAGDRQYSFYRATDATRFPWLSARDHDRLVLYRPTFSDPDDPRRRSTLRMGRQWLSTPPRFSNV